MNTRRLTDQTFSLIDTYLNFKVGSAVTNIPYFNNRKQAKRASLRAEVGKGSPREILDEVSLLTLRDKITVDAFTNDTFKKFLVENDIGIDCSGLAYYILASEARARDKHQLDRLLSYPLARGLFRKIKAHFYPVENTDVATFAHDKNSHIIEIKDAAPGDIITMESDDASPLRNHILVIHQIEYQNFVPITLHYTHSIAWPSDGEYGHGVRQGIIDIVDSTKPLTEQRWIENNTTDTQNYTLARAKASKTALRRIKGF